VKLIDVTQLAEMLGVKPKTIYDWSHKGLIPCVKLGRLLRFDPDDIERLVKSKKRERALN